MYPEKLQSINYKLKKKLQTFMARLKNRTSTSKMNKGEVVRVST